MNLKRLAAICMIVAFFAASSFCPGSWASDATERVAQTFSAPFQVNIEGIKTERVYTREGTMTVSARVVLQQPQFIYMEYLEPTDAKGQILVDDGKSRVCFTPQLNKVTVLPSLVSPLLKQRRERTMDILFENFMITDPIATTFLDRDAWVVSLRPKSGGIQVLKLWIDKETSLILKKERYDATGKLMSSEAYTSIQFDITVDKQILLENVPPTPTLAQDAISQLFLTLQEMRLRVARSLYAPTYVPSGYMFQEGELLNDSTIKLVYTNGMDIITLFQRPRIKVEMEYEHEVKSGNLSLKFKRTALENTLVWGERGKTFVLMGPISLEDMLEMAKSIQ